VKVSEILQVLRRRWWILAVAVVGGLLGAYLASWLTVPTYQASLTMFLAQANGQPLQDLTNNPPADDVATYARLAQSRLMVQMALDDLDADEPPTNVTVTLTGTDSPIFMTLTVTADSAEDARALAQVYADEFPDFVADFQGLPATTAPPVAVFGDVSSSNAPISPDVARNTAAGLGLGLVVGVAGIFLAEALDRRLRTPEQAVAATGLPLLATIPATGRRESYLSVDSTGSARAEALRQFRANLRFARAGLSIRSLGVTSASGREGKTATAVELALVNAREGLRVLLVDADLRRRGLREVLGLQDERGLTDVVTGRHPLDDVLQTYGVISSIAVLTSGPAEADASELLGSDRMRKLVQEVGDRFDLVIYDTAPVLPVADTQVLAESLDAVLLVARMGKSRRDRLHQAASLLDAVDVKVLGVAVQGARPTGDIRYISGARGRQTPRPATGSEA
jgi:capsular exopolysaccharide synthesis family protein